MNAETKFQNKVLSDLHKIPKTWWEKISQKSTCGTPDILGTCGVYFVAIELKKSDKEKPTPIQQVKLDLISACGAVAISANPQNWIECLAKIKALADSQDLYGSKGTNFNSF